MKSPRCRDCRFFVGQKGGGECRRHPPTMVLAPAKTLQGMDMVPSAAFPPVTTETWCGEFRGADTLNMTATEILEACAPQGQG
jgi:hypothetical protein